MVEASGLEPVMVRVQISPGVQQLSEITKENKMRMEIRASEGGADAEAFALELGQAIAKHSGAVLEMDGTTVVLGCL